MKTVFQTKKLTVVENVCPQNGVSKREEIKTLIKTLSSSYPDLKSKIFGSMQRFPLEGWKPLGGENKCIDACQVLQEI